MSTKPIVPAWLPKTGPGRVATYPAAASTTITATATAIHFTFHRIIPGPPSRGGRGRRSASRRVRAARSECRPGGDPQLPSLRAHTVVDAEEPDRRLGRDPESVVDLEVRRQRPVRLRVARVREDDAGDPADPLEERERVQREAVLPRHDRHVVAAKPPRRVAAQRALSAEVELFLDGKRAASGPRCTWPTIVALPVGQYWTKSISYFSKLKSPAIADSVLSWISWPRVGLMGSSRVSWSAPSSTALTVPGVKTKPLGTVELVSSDGPNCVLTDLIPYVKYRLGAVWIGVVNVT